MTNFDKWKIYTKNVESCELWIEAAWYFTIATALERRVWIGELGFPNILFPNLFIVLVGPPSAGKGQILGPTAALLQRNLYVPKNVTVEDWKAANEGELPPLFTPGADATTYEQLTFKLARATKTTTVRARGKDVPYVYCSMYFTLEELVTLFRRTGKHQKETKIADLFLQIFDCKDHRYEKRNSVHDIIKNPSMCVLAGTQPDILMELAQLGLVKNGLASRFITIFASQPRFQSMFLPDPQEDQFQAMDYLTDYLKELTSVVGKLTVTDEARRYSEDWFNNKFAPSIKATPRELQDFVSRRRVQTHKFAIATHFANSTDFELTAADYHNAITFLDRVSESIQAHHGGFGENPDISMIRLTYRTIKDFGRTGASYPELLAALGADMSMDKLSAFLLHLEMEQKITRLKLKEREVYVAL